MSCIRISFAFVVLLAAVSAMAGESFEDSLMTPVFRPDGSPIDRWRITGDINCDGFEDVLVSEDITRANDNGLYLAIYLRDSTGKLSYYDTIFDHPQHLSIERCGSEIRIWNYEYLTNGIGMLNFSVVSPAGIIPGGRIELRENGRISMGLRNIVLRTSDVKFSVQRSRVVAGKVEWYEVRQPLSMLTE